MMNFNSFEQREWWVSSGFWYPPIATTRLVSDMNLLYRETGLVRVSTRSKDMSVSWDVDNVDPESLSSVIDYLQEVEDVCQSVTLNFFKVAWAQEQYCTVDEATIRIKEVQSFQNVALLPDTRVHRLPLSEISSSAALLRWAYEAIERRNWFDQLLNGTLAQYGLFFSRNSRREAMTFSYVGEESECARMLGESWRCQALGQPSDSAFADERFDHRVSTSYDYALASSEPILEHIVGLVDIGPHYIWMPYQRLLLPDGQRLACFVRLTRHVNCPFLVHQH